MPVLGVVVGTMMTLVVQSSSATIAVLQNFASQAGPDGVTSILGLTGAIPILLGDNIGTTITALLASVGQPRDAKRTAVAHCIFNLSGALIFIWLFAVTLRWLPVFGMQTPGNNFTGFRAFLDKVYYMTLPVLVMTVGSLGGMTRYVRAAMIEALSMDYIRTARAKGLREKVVVYSHAWRNALLPVITVLIGWFISIFSGSLIIEQMFALNGMGQLYYQGLMNNDFELALAIQMFYVLIALVGQLITDLSYGIVDPRVRVNK